MSATATQRPRPPHPVHISNHLGLTLFVVHVRTVLLLFNAGNYATIMAASSWASRFGWIVVVSLGQQHGRASGASKNTNRTITNKDPLGFTTVATKNNRKAEKEGFEKEHTMEHAVASVHPSHPCCFWWIFFFIHRLCRTLYFYS